MANLRPRARYPPNPPATVHVHDLPSLTEIKKRKSYARTWKRQVDDIIRLCNANGEKLEEYRSLIRESLTPEHFKRKMDIASEAGYKYENIEAYLAEFAVFKAYLLYYVAGYIYPRDAGIKRQKRRSRTAGKKTKKKTTV